MKHVPSPGFSSPLRKFVGSVAVGVVLLVPSALCSAAGTDSDWTRYGLHGGEDRNSPLTQIDDRNVGTLGLVWSLDLPERSALEATPLEIGGVIYAVGGYGAVYAVDAVRGTLLWTYDPRANEADPRGARRMYAANRGLAYWNGKIYVATKDGRLVALATKTGKVVWSSVFLPQGTNSTSTGSPRVMDGKIIIGSSGSEFNGRGSVTALDAETGKLAWRFFLVPGDPSRGFEDDTQAMAARTWSGEWWKYGGGGNPWNAITFDEQLGQVYIGTGNPGPWLDKFRSPDGRDNLFTSSIVALDAKTGQYRWHYQTTPNDVWDFDSVADIVLTNLSIDGQSRQVLMQANKNGFFYVLDRATGKLLSAEKFAKANWASHIDLKTGRPVETAGSRYKEDRVTIFPGMYGAHDWQSMAYNARTGLAYIPAISVGAVYAPSAEAEAAVRNQVGRIVSLQGVDAFPVNDQLGGVTRRGSLVAWDVLRQKEAWRVDHPAEYNGGTLTTAGNLVFQGLSNGQLHAYAADSGKPLWSFDTKLGVMAAPITFSVKGRQYLSLLVGSGAGAGETEIVGNNGWKYGVHPRRLLTFALQGKALLPATPPPQYTVVPLDDPALVLDPVHVKAGGVVYDQVCGGCHGAAVIANGGAPDLRASPVALDRTAFVNVLHQGLLVRQGMPRFDDFSDVEVSDLYLFIRSRARESLPVKEPERSSKQ